MAAVWNGAETDVILWCAVAGALIGWIAGDLDGIGFWTGGIAGAGMGWWLRRILRDEIARAQDPVYDALAALRLEVTASPVHPSAGDRAAERVSPWERPRVTAAAPTEAADSVPAASSPVAEAALAPVAPEARADDATHHAPPPAGPNPVERAIAAATGWLFGGNTIVRVGLVILFVGLSFLARYVAGAGLFPIEARLALVAAAGVALLGVGFRKRAAKPDFALSLQGGGVAVLYLTLFAASRLFQVIPAAAAFPLMVAVCALGCALALLQNAQILAATSFAGGFAVPLLLGGEGGPLGLFLYYTVLNVAVPVIAHARAWRIIGLMGFVVTFGIATLWGLLVYDPSDYAVSQTFLILFVLIYVVTGILNAAHRPGRFGNAVDGTLLFGPALAGFGLQAGLVRDMPFGTAFAALGFGALYLAVALYVARRGRGDNRVLVEGLAAVAVGFVTLAVPLALGARWTASVWALEGAGAVWLGVRQARWTPRAFGLALQGAALLAFLPSIRAAMPSAPLSNPAVLGALLLALPALAIAWWLRRPPPPGASRLATGYEAIERALPQPLFLYGFFLWCVALALEINRIAPPRVAGGPPAFALDGNARGLATMLACVASAAVAAWAGRRLGWRVALWPGRATLAVMVLAFLGRGGADGFVFVTPNWLFWAAALVLHYWLLRADDREGAAETLPLRRVAHVGGAWLVAGIAIDGLWLGIDRAGLWGSSWAGVTFLTGGIAALLALTLWAGRANRPDAPARWPLRPHAEAYYWIAAVPVALAVFAGAGGAAMLAAGETAPLPYVPLLNPVELSVALAIAALMLWRRMAVAALPPPPGVEALHGPAPWIALAALGFVAINTVWLRIAHHYLGIAWEGAALFGSFTVQAGLSILWTSLGLAVTVTAHRRGLRAVWLGGATLLGVVVAKLLLVDLSNADGAARIVTFIVVGVLMLVVGYFAPLPPRDGGEARA